MIYVRRQFIKMMCHHHHSGRLGAFKQCVYLLNKSGTCAHIQPHTRFIQKQQLRAGQHGPGNQGLHLFA